jgi:polysaccharide biosynthesis protein PslG
MLSSAPHTRALWRLAASAFALLAITCIWPSHSRAAEPGVVADLTWFPPEAQRAQEATMIQDSGSRWVRLSIGWRDFEPSKGSYNSWSLTAYDQEFQRARAAGQKIIVSVSGSPQWASGSTNEQTPPRDPADYADFMRFVAQRYGQYVDAWEVWNEENIQRFWSTGPNAAQYVALLKAAYPAIKAADPTSKVVFGGTSLNDYPFIEAAYAAGAKGSFDVMATHPYACASPESISRYSNGRMTIGSFPAYREVRATMLANGDDKPIWFTEFGWASSTQQCGVSEATQADYLTRAYRLIEQDPYVQVATWYEFRNNFWSGDANTVEDSYGLTKTDFSPKPAYQAFKDYALTGTTPPSDPPPTPTDPPPTPTDPPPTPTDPGPTPTDPTPAPDPTPTPADPSPTPTDTGPAPTSPAPVPTDSAGSTTTSGSKARRKSRKSRHALRAYKRRRQSRAA